MIAEELKKNKRIPKERSAIVRSKRDQTDSDGLTCFADIQSDG